MADLNYEKLPADRHIALWVGPSGGTTLGITDVDEPLAVELNNSGGTSGILNASQATSWNDFDFGTQASETNNEPSLADAGSYEEFGRSNYGGAISWFRPQAYDDLSNLLSNVYDLTDEKYHKVDIALRIDGAVLATSPAVDGDFVSAYRVQSGGDQENFTPGESKRRTITYNPKSDFSHYTVVGDHTITAIEPASYTMGDKGRIRASQGGRDRTNALRVTSSNAAVIQVYRGGFFEVVGAGSADVTFLDEGTGDTETVSIVVA